MKFLCITIVALLAIQAVLARPSEKSPSFKEKTLKRLREFRDAAKQYLQDGLSHFQEKYISLKQSFSKLLGNVKEKLKPYIENVKGAAKQRLQKFSEKLEELHKKGFQFVEQYREKVSESVAKKIIEIKEVYETVKHHLEEKYHKNKACAEMVRPDLKQLKEEFVSKVMECKQLTGDKFDEVLDKLKEKVEAVSNKIKDAVHNFVNRKQDDVDELEHDVENLVAETQHYSYLSEVNVKDCASEAFYLAKDAVKKIVEKIKTC